MARTVPNAMTLETLGLWLRRCRVVGEKKLNGWLVVVVGWEMDVEFGGFQRSR